MCDVFIDFCSSMAAEAAAYTRINIQTVSMLLIQFLTTLNRSENPNGRHWNEERTDEIETVLYFVKNHYWRTNFVYRWLHQAHINGLDTTTAAIWRDFFRTCAVEGIRILFMRFQCYNRKTVQGSLKPSNPTHALMPVYGPDDWARSRSISTILRIQRRPSWWTVKTYGATNMPPPFFSTRRHRYNFNIRKIEKVKDWW